MKKGTPFSKFSIRGSTLLAQNHLQKMYNDQSFAVGLNLPSASPGRSESNGAQMLFCQGSRDLDKAQQVFQQLTKQDATNLDGSPSDCNFSHSGAVMASMGRGVLENFQASAGLMRYHSAPGSFLATLAGDDNDVMHNISGTRPDNGLSQILSNDSSLASESNSGVLKHNDSCQSSQMQQENSIKNQADYSRMTTMHNSSHLMRSTSNVAEENLGKENHLATILENDIDDSQKSFCRSQMSMMCQARDAQTAEQHLVNNTFKHNPLLYTNLDSSGETSGNLTPKNSLVRHSSSPPAALSQVPPSAKVFHQSGYPGAVMTKSNMGTTALTSGNSSCGNMGFPNSLNNQMNFMRQSSSPAQLLTQLTMDLDIPEVMDKLGMQRCHSSAEHLLRCDSDSARLSNVGRNQGYVSSLSAGSWEDGTMIRGNYEGMQNIANISSRKRGRDMNEKMIAGVHLPEKLGEDGCHSVSALANRHFGLFKSTSAEMAMENLMEDSVPCRIRAKRGCATHPRSIAERVRRTRISDRMRKLQELVPNMDKQTNTADMLDEAVEYVKYLQRQVQELSEKKRKCECASRNGTDTNNAQAN